MPSKTVSYQCWTINPFYDVKTLWSSLRTTLLRLGVFCCHCYKNHLVTAIKRNQCDLPCQRPTLWGHIQPPWPLWTLWWTASPLDVSGQQYKLVCLRLTDPFRLIMRLYCHFSSSSIGLVKITPSRLKWHIFPVDVILSWHRSSKLLCYFCKLTHDYLHNCDDLIQIQIFPTV